MLLGNRTQVDGSFLAYNTRTTIGKSAVSLVVTSLTVREELVIRFLLKTFSSIIKDSLDEKKEEEEAIVSWPVGQSLVMNRFNPVNRGVVKMCFKKYWWRTGPSTNVDGGSLD
jgi:hypothetical protein